MTEAQAKKRVTAESGVRIASVPELVDEARNGRMIALIDDAAQGYRACLMLAGADGDTRRHHLHGDARSRPDLHSPRRAAHR